MMKKIIYILTVGLSVGLVSSCNQKFEPIFDESASQRIENTMKSYDNILKSSETGWLLQYFPHEEQKYGGYNFFLKFTDPNTVEVKTERYKDGKEAETSTYGIIQSGGPVLTFDTYNTLMHEFATPSSAEYLGKQGDFEFLIMSSNEDEVTLRGRKTGNTMKLIKIKKSVEDYIADTRKIADFLSGATLRSKFGDVIVENSLDASNRQLIFEYKDKEGKTETKKIAFVYTDTGIQLYESIKINELEASNFILDKASKKLISVDKKVEIEMVFAPVDFTTLTWSFDVSGGDVSDLVKTAWKEAYDADFVMWKEELQPIIELGLVRGNVVIGMASFSPRYGKEYPARYLLGFKGSFENENYIVIEGLGEGSNWNWYKHLSPIVDMVLDNSPYKTETINDKEVKMVSVKKPDVWFVIKR